MVEPIEAIVDSLIRIKNGLSPESEYYHLRNPLGLRSFAKLGRHAVNDDGLRVFMSHLAGYKAAVFDVHLKASGKSRAGLKPDDKLRNLLGVFDIKEKAAVDNCVTFIRRALKDMTITADTPLKRFVEKEPDGRPESE